MSRLSGRTALVTGGSRGIGAAIVRRLAREGADVAFTYLKASAEASDVVADVEAAGRKGVAIRADSGDPKLLTDAVDRAAKELGRLDVLVSSAGRLRFKPVVEFTVDDFDETIAVDLRAAFVA